jgi:hypothetical protein
MYISFSSVVRTIHRCVGGKSNLHETFDVCIPSRADALLVNSTTVSISQFLREAILIWKSDKQD